MKDRAHAVEPRRGRALVFIMASAGIAGLELGPRIAGGHAMPLTLLILTAILCTSLLAMPWLPLQAGTVVVVCVLVGAVSDSDFHIVGAATYFVVADWASRGLVWLALAVLVGVESVAFVTSPTPVAQLVSTLTFGTLAVGIGLAVRRFDHRLDAAQREVEVAREELRGEMSAALHNTVARDLARIAATADHLAAQGAPVTVDEIRTLGNLASAALGGVNAVIAGTERESDTTLVEAVTSCRDALRSRGIELQVEDPGRLQERLVAEQESLACLIIGEAATNALKYAAPRSKATFRLETGEGETALIVFSSVVRSGESGVDGLGAGFGLTNLSRTLAARGGGLWVRQSGENWVVLAELPASEGSSPRGDESSDDRQGAGQW